MRISVVMTTYNGQKYLMEQLQSIANQTVAPDEVLIFDDGSKDDTISIIKKFIRDNDLLWNLIENEENLGWKKNFMQGIDRATGDIIFLSDQDDIWGTRKIEYMTHALINNPDADLAICQYIETPEDTTPYINTEEFIVPSKQFKQFQNNISAIRTIRPGCTYAFRKNFFELIKDAWCEGLAHDLLIYMAAWMNGSIVQCNGKLHCFRRHQGANSIKGTEYDAKARYERVLQQYHAYEILAKKTVINNKDVYGLGQWLLLRQEVLNNKKIAAAFHLWKYIKYYPSVKTWGVDVLTLIRG